MSTEEALNLTDGGIKKVKYRFRPFGLLSLILFCKMEFKMLGLLTRVESA